jgi:hypothetical protein
MKGKSGKAIQDHEGNFMPLGKSKAVNRVLRFGPAKKGRKRGGSHPSDKLHIKR